MNYINKRRHPMRMLRLNELRSVCGAQMQPGQVEYGPDGILTVIMGGAGSSWQYSPSLGFYQGTDPTELYGPEGGNDLRESDESPSFDWIPKLFLGLGALGMGVGAVVGIKAGTAEAAHIMGIGGRYAFSAAMIAICESPYAAAAFGTTVGLTIAAVIVIGSISYYVLTD